MEKTTGGMELVLTNLLSLGLPGIGLVCLGYALIKIWQRNQELNDKNYEIGREVTAALTANTAALQNLSALLAMQARNMPRNTTNRRTPTP